MRSSSRTSSFTLPSKTSAEKQYQNHIGRQPVGTVTGLKGRQDRKLNDSKEQAAQDQGYRVGNPQAFRQHRDDRSRDEQPTKNSMPEVGVISETHHFPAVRIR